MIMMSPNTVLPSAAQRIAAVNELLFGFSIYEKRTFGL